MLHWISISKILAAQQEAGQLHFTICPSAAGSLPLWLWQSDIWICNVVLHERSQRSVQAFTYAG
jgi:hypothetical protein